MPIGSGTDQETINPELACQFLFAHILCTAAIPIFKCLVNASILSEVVRQLRLDQSNGFNSGTLSIEPFGGSRCRGVLATTYAFSMVFSWSEKEREASSAEKRTPENSGLERGTLLRTSDGCAKPSLSECTDTPPATELETTRVRVQASC